jgi:hypothetical protein
MRFKQVTEQSLGTRVRQFVPEIKLPAYPVLKVDRTALASKKLQFEGVPKSKVGSNISLPVERSIKYRHLYR